MSKDSELRVEQILDIGREIDRYVVRGDLHKAIYAVDTMRVLLLTEQLDRERDLMRKERLGEINV